LTIPFRLKQSGGQFTTPPPPPANPFASNPSGGYPNVFNPAGNMPPKQRSSAGIIVGVVLILIGAAVLIDNYDLIPDFDFGNLWPVILVVVGGALIVSGQKTQPWDKQDWHTADKKEDTTTNNSATTDNTSTVES